MFLFKLKIMNFFMRLNIRHFITVITYQNIYYSPHHISFLLQSGNNSIYPEGLSPSSCPDF